MTDSNYVDTKMLENWLKSAADLLRGSSDGLGYIITLLFYKRLCDVFDDEISEIKAEIQNLDEREFRKIVKEAQLTRFFIPKEAIFQEVRKTTVNLGERLDSALITIARENPTLQGVIDVVRFNEARYDAGRGERIRLIDDDKLSKLLEIFNRHSIGLDEADSDVIGQSYEYLIRLYASGKGKTAGEFYTPKEVALLMAYCLDPKEGEEIFDPACGSGGLLIKNQLVLKEKTGGKIGRPIRLIGQERDHLTYALAKINMFIHNIDESDIRLGDTLTNPAFLENGQLKKFDIVVANPMWNQDGYDENFYDSDKYDRFLYGYPPKSTADWGWVQNMFASLNESGRMAVVLDTGAVARGSGENRNREKEIRRKFIEQDFIETVLLLPENLFYNTGAPGIIMFLRKQKPEKRRGKILLINASREFQKGKPKNFLGDENIKKIVDVYKNFKEVDGFSKIITQKGAADADFNLSPSRFVSIVDEETHRPIGEIKKDLKKTESEREKIEKKVEGILRGIKE